jgi:hypothetical protein
VIALSAILLIIASAIYYAIKEIRRVENTLQYRHFGEARVKNFYQPIEPRERRHRTVGARVRSSEYDAFEEVAKSRGMSPGTLCALLVRAEIAGGTAPSMVPETTGELETA